MFDIIIDDEFRDALRPLSDDELDGLTARVLSEGIRDPLVVWVETGILLDGHHRMAIAEEYDLDYNVTTLPFASRAEALRWIHDNQAARRNWTKDERNDWMRAKRADGWTYQRIADTAGVSFGTAHNVTSDVNINSDIENERGQQRPATYERTNGNGKQELPLTAANHAVSDTPGYDGDEWYTPEDIVAAARVVMGGIDLDPATSEQAQEVLQIANCFTKQDDGLAHDWFGNVWLNPPYSTPLINQFVDKMIGEFDAERVRQALVITNNSSDTKWFHAMLSRFPACFIRGRVGFWRPNHAEFGARQGQVIFYIGDNKGYFADVFSAFGLIVEVVR